MEPPYKKQKICFGCRDDQPNQMAHIGGCLSDIPMETLDRLEELYVSLKHLEDGLGRLTKKFPDVDLNCFRPLTEAITSIQIEIHIIEGM